MDIKEKLLQINDVVNSILSSGLISNQAKLKLKRIIIYQTTDNKNIPNDNIPAFIIQINSGRQAELYNTGILAFVKKNIPKNGEDPSKDWKSFMEHFKKYADIDLSNVTVENFGKKCWIPLQQKRVDTMIDDIVQLEKEIVSGTNMFDSIEKICGKIIPQHFEIFEVFDFLMNQLLDIKKIGLNYAA